MMQREALSAVFVSPKPCRSRWSSNNQILEVELSIKVNGKVINETRYQTTSGTTITMEYEIWDSWILNSEGSQSPV